jgi:hypothetical protein
VTKATLTKTTIGQYIVTTESGTVVDMGRRMPSAKRMRKACRAALSEEVIVVEVSTGTEWHL